MRHLPGQSTQDRRSNEIVGIGRLELGQELAPREVEEIAKAGFTAGIAWGLGIGIIGTVLISAIFFPGKR